MLGTHQRCMPKEGTHPQLPRSYEAFGLSEHEYLYSSVSDQCFHELLNRPDTIVHNLEITSNSYGEFVFVTLSRTVNGRQVWITFFGLGYHEQRERWLTDDWRWYESYSPTKQEQTTILDKAEVMQQIEARRKEIKANADDTPPSARAVLFAMLADLTDEDGAYSELEDLESSGLLSGLLGEDDE